MQCKKIKNGWVSKRQTYILTEISYCKWDLTCFRQKWSELGFWVTLWVAGFYNSVSFSGFITRGFVGAWSLLQLQNCCQLTVIQHYCCLILLLYKTLMAFISLSWKTMKADYLMSYVASLSSHWWLTGIFWALPCYAKLCLNKQEHLKIF